MLSVLITLELHLYSLSAVYCFVKPLTMSFTDCVCTHDAASLMFILTVLFFQHWYLPIKVHLKEWCVEVIKLHSLKR